MSGFSTPQTDMYISLGYEKTQENLKIGGSNMQATAAMHCYPKKGYSSAFCCI